MNNRNKEILKDGIARRIKHVFVSALSEIEKQFPDIVNNKKWQIARFNILTVGNDALKATKQELDEYQNETNILDVKRSDQGLNIKMSMDLVELLHNAMFYDLGITIFAMNEAQEKCLSRLLQELNCGAIDMEDNKLFYHIYGLKTCIDVLSILDKLAWPVDIRAKYVIWRKNVVNLYRRQG